MRLSNTLNIHKHPELSIILIMAIVNLKTTLSLKNINLSKEVETLLEILKQLEVNITINHNIITIDATNIINKELPLKLLKKRNVTIYILPILTNLFGYTYIPLDKDKSIYPITHITNLMEYFGMSSTYDSKKIISQKIRTINNIVIDIKDISNIRYIKEVINVAILLSIQSLSQVIIINPLINKETKKLIKFLQTNSIKISILKKQIIIN